MILFYIIAMIPILIGTIIFCVSEKINWWEWVLGSAIALLVSAIMHGIAIHSLTADIECWSGKITHACHFPQWIEQYQQCHTETYYTGSGKNRTSHTRTWYTTEHATHYEHWVAYLNFGTLNEEKDIDANKFNEIKSNFGNAIEDGGKQWYSNGGFRYSGDNNIYRAVNKTGYLYPVTTIRTFSNRIKAAPTVFSFIKVPTNVPVYNWPKNPNWQVSDRLINEPRISKLEFDRMNSRLGPVKLVDVCFINFGDKGSEIAKYQEAYWLRGKKNSITMCYGQLDSNNIPSWSVVFGWSNSEICKRNLESILLEHPINNDVLPLIEKEIKTGYVIKEWEDFSYISVEPPRWSYFVLVISMIVTQTGFWLWAGSNEFDKEGTSNYNSRLVNTNYYCNDIDEMRKKWRKR